MGAKEYKIKITGRLNDNGVSSFRIDAKSTNHHIWEIGKTLGEAIIKFDKEFANCVEEEQ